MVMALPACVSVDPYLAASSTEATAVFGEKEHMVFIVPAASGTAPEVVIPGRPPLSSEEVLATQLGEFMALGRYRTIRLAVSGQSPARTRAVLLQALEYNRDQVLSGLTLLLLDAKQDDGEVRRAVERAGAQFLFRTLDVTTQ
jgi:hypothetical protein